MNENKIDRNEEIEIDIQRLFSILWDKLWLILVAAVTGALATFLVTFFMITPKYESSAMFYVNNNSLSVGDASFSISSSDITASKSLVDSYIVILQTRETLNDVMDYAGVDYSYESIKKMLETYERGEKSIVRLGYGEKVGAPVLFDRRYFEQLRRERME